MGESRGLSEMKFEHAIRLSDRKVVPRDSASPRLLPLYPIWPGFAINPLY